MSCVPNDLLAYNGCTQTYNDQQWKAAMAYLLCQINGAGVGTCDATTLANDAKCMAVLSDAEMKTVLLNIILQYAVDAGYASASTLLADIKCLVHVPKHLLEAIILRQLCSHFTAT